MCAQIKVNISVILTKIQLTYISLKLKRYSSKNWRIDRTQFYWGLSECFYHKPPQNILFKVTSCFTSVFSLLRLGYFVKKALLMFHTSILSACQHWECSPLLCVFTWDFQNSLTTEISQVSLPTTFFPHCCELDHSVQETAWVSYWFPK